MQRVIRIRKGEGPIMWNPFNKVVQDHRDGTIYTSRTNKERKKRGLPVPWKPEMGNKEATASPVY